MDTTTFTLTGTFSNDAIVEFASTKGYRSKITVNKVDENNNVVQVEQDNPKSPSDFCADYFKTLIINEISWLQVSKLQQDLYKNLEDQKKAIRDQVAQALTINEA